MFELEAILPGRLSADACNDVQKVDQELLDRRAQILKFETEFRNARSFLGL